MTRKKNANLLLNSLYGHKSRNEVEHSPVILKRSVCEKAWKYFELPLLNSCELRYQNKSSIGFTNHLIPQVMLYDRMAEKGTSDSKTIMMGFHSNRLMNLLSAVKRFSWQFPKTRALQMWNQTKHNFVTLDGDKMTITKILEPLFSKKSPWKR
ncbi:MAG: hypothetical protein EXR74_10000 [Bdellovibrionales bacterium]|nr:hypothetical protein [Bdellovibrionales bacterium]